MEIIYLAGINDSGPGHWQNHWLKRLGGTWVEHQDWDHPNADDWASDLKIALALIQNPKIILAHSLGCLTLTQWAKDHQDPGIHGAFLVAPPDPSAPGYPKESAGFEDPFSITLPFPTVLVASRNDPYASLDFSKRLAEHWGSHLLDVGEKGHINLKSSLGVWEEGLKAFKAFRQSLG